MSADMLGEASITDAQRARFAGLVKKSGANMNRLIQDLLNVARMEQGKLAVDLQPVAPELLIDNAIEAMRPLAAEKSLTLVEHLQERRHPEPPPNSIDEQRRESGRDERVRRMSSTDDGAVNGSPYERGRWYGLVRCFRI